LSDSSAIAETRERTRQHYDRFPFGFDQVGMLEEKLENRIMGEAIRRLPQGNGTTVVDVGCGACRVAQLVRSIGDAATISVDLSLGSLRAARARDVGSLINGDNLRIPLRSGIADLVVSNGVIHHTPDARQSFRELARIVRPGGTLVVSVYDRRSWYYWVWRFPGSAIRHMQHWFGDEFLRYTVFPIFHLGVSILLPIVIRRWVRLPVENSWTLFHDQFTTPQCTFHTFEELQEWARESGLECQATRREAARQLATLELSRPERA
jgi:SAM-dependent methyltransferase